MPTWPDPNSKGDFLFTAANPLNQGSHAYLSASGACNDLQPKGSGLMAALIQVALARLLNFSVVHASSWPGQFPDPKVVDNGGRRGVLLQVQGEGIDPNSPQYQSASQACQHLLPRAGKGAPS